MERRSTVAVPFFYSLLIHIVILSFLLTLPLSRGGTNAESFWGYFVYLKEGGEEAVRKSAATKNVSKPEIRNAKKEDTEDLLKSKESIESEVAAEPDKKTIAPEKEAVKTAEMREDIAEKPAPPAPGIKEMKTEAKEVKKTEAPDAQKVSQSLEIVKPPQMKERATEKSAAPEKKEVKKMPDTPAEAEKVFNERKTEIKETKIARTEIHEVKEMPAKAEQKVETIPEVLPPKPDEKSSQEIPSMVDISQENHLLSFLEPPVSESIVPEVKESPPALPKSEIRSEKDEGEKEIRTKKIVKTYSEGEKGSHKKISKKQKTKMTKKGEAKKPASQIMPNSQITPNAAPSASTEKPAQEAPSVPGPLHEKTPASAPESIASLSPSPSGIADTGGSAKQTDSGLLPEASAQEKNGDDEKREPQVKEETKGKEKESAIGVPMPEALLFRDIEIEVYSGGTEMAGVSMRLMKKPYPTAHEKKERRKEKVEGIDERGETDSGGKAKRVFSVTKAEKGIYTFVIENKGERTFIEKMVFRLYGKGEKERIKEYPSVELVRDAVLKYHFILPDALFWDDEERFSGSIEDSNSVTKFDYSSGLLWREEKDY